MDQREGVRYAAGRLLFSSFCNPSARGGTDFVRRTAACRWEPPFCVLPGGAAPAWKAEPVDGGLW
jgi:hypothetical protein